MRGKGADAYSFYKNRRITPAYAGKSAPDGCWWMLRKDHPRLCGEKPVFRKQSQPHRGSPPPMRGKGVDCFYAALRVRITPAYAGKRFLRIRLESALRDHPRLCGEKHPLLPPPFHDIGSPPPMRGKARFMNLNNSAVGITPAYAGKSLSVSPARTVLRDHPRLCGEKLWSLLCCDRVVGSPPPMRGKATPRTQPSHQSRITPAYAGKRR